MKTQTLTRARALLLTAVAVGLTAAAGTARAADPAMSADARTKASALQDKAIAFLLAQQKDDGTWGEPGRGQPAVTSLVTRALLGTGKVDAKHPAIQKAVKLILTFRQEDGGIYKAELRNYNTAIAMMALHATGLPEYKPIVEAAQKLLLKGQYGADEQIDELANPNSPAKKDARYGGNGYGEPKNEYRPDVSNTSFQAQALKETGLPADHPYWKRMQTFLSRSQLRSESNDQPWAKDYGDDGGFVYGPNDTRGPKQLDPATGKELLRSYGSMTYAGLKSFLYAGLSKDDPRVKSAYQWVRRNYTLEENPAMGKSGLYYYYMVFARALREWGEPTIEDLRAGTKHNWREELVAKLAAEQASDGSWANTDKRWMESDPILVTAYALLTLREVLK